MKIPPVGAEFLHVDERREGQRDMTKLRVAFRKVANPPTNQTQDFYFFYTHYHILTVLLQKNSLTLFDFSEI